MTIRNYSAISLLGKYLFPFLLVTAIYTSCRMEACRNLDPSATQFTINGDQFPDLDDPASDSNYYFGSGKINLQASTSGYWFLNDSLLSQVADSKYDLELGTGSFTIGFGLYSDFPTTLKRLDVSEPEETPEPVKDELADLINEVKDDLPAVTTKPVMSGKKIDPEEAKKRQEERERIRREKEMRDEQKRLEEAKKQEEEQRRRDAINRELEKRKAKELAEAEYKKLLRNLNKKQRALETADLDCIERSSGKLNSGEVTISVMKDMKIKGLSVFSSGPGRIRFNLSGPNGESAEAFKYVNTGRSDILFSEWSSMILRANDIWTLGVKDDRIKLHTTDKCVKASNADLRCTGSVFLFNLDYLTE